MKDEVESVILEWRLPFDNMEDTSLEQTASGDRFALPVPSSIKDLGSVNVEPALHASRHDFSLATSVVEDPA
jgi:hypothetical protein